LHESEVGFLDIPLFELDLELAGLKTASCKEECPSRVLVEAVDWPWFLWKFKTVASLLKSTC